MIVVQIWTCFVPGLDGEGGNSGYSLR